MQIVTGERIAQPGAGPLADDAGGRAEPESAPWCITLAFLRSRDLLDYGDVDGAIQACERALALATGSGTQFLLPMVHGVMATISLLRDSPGDADAQLELAPSDLDPLASDEMQNRLMWIRARVLDARVGPSAALVCLERVCADITAFVPMLVEEPGSAAWFVRLALSQGDEARARMIALETEQLLADNRSFPCIHAIALHVRGLLDRDADALDRGAAMHWQPWARASATEDTGTVLDDLGRHEESRDYLERAISGYAFAGSDRDTNRVRARLRTTAHVRRNRAGRPVEGWASLTEGELRVVSLVVQGLTNRATAERAFLSRYTVDSHLRQAFRKLNISSRVELVRFALEHERTTS
jgi:DNA-binding CsgD family transcriptional regulator